MYDGRVLLAQGLTVDEDGLSGAAFETSFKRFLSWRDFGFPGQPVANFFGMAAIRSSDGAFMLGEMNPATSNAGLLYFPAGTPEPCDADVEGRVDLASSALRELAEETGIGAEEVDVEADWTVVLAGPRIGCMKLVQAHQTADELKTRLALHNAASSAPELVSLVPVRTRADYDAARMPAFVTRYLDTMLDA